MQVVYEEYHIKNCKLLIFSYYANSQQLIDDLPKWQYCQICCRTIVGRHETNRFVVGKLSEK